jgi:hypothetical protein
VGLLPQRHALAALAQPIETILSSLVDKVIALANAS